MSDLPSVSLVSLVRDWPQFHSLVKYHWEHLDYPKDKLEWILIDDSNTDYSDNFPLDERILYIRVSPKDYLEKIGIFNKSMVDFVGREIEEIKTSNKV